MSSSNSETLDQRNNNGSKDSTAMTIEYLRARLLSERSVCRVARLRSEELTKRVVQLEEQLKTVTLQRKRAEKATSEVLAILENHGMSDVSDAVDSSSDEEEIRESNNGGVITNGQESSTSIRDEGVNSSSEVESSPSIGRSLSWKSGHRSQNSPRLKHIDSSRRAYATIAPKHSSTNRTGKSCRRNRRQEIRSTVEVSPNGSRISLDDVSTTLSEDAPNCSNHQFQTMEEGSSHIKERDMLNLGAKPKENQIGNDHFHSDDGEYQDMEGALQHQEQLIGKYEAEENAQKEWEEKFGENNTRSPDSLDPANNSNVTEERYDKTTGKPCSAAAIMDPDQDGATCSKEDRVPKDLASPPHVDPCLPEKDGKITDESSMPDSETSSSGNSNKLQSENENQSFASPGRSVQSCAHDSSSGSKSQTAQVPNGVTNDVGSILRVCADDSTSQRRSQGALVSNGTTNDVGSILEALQQAKLSLKQKLEDQPMLGEGQIPKSLINPFESVTKARNRVEIPGIGPAIFRLPTDLQCEASSRPNSSGSTGLDMPDYYPRIYSNTYFSSPYMDPKSSTLASGKLHHRSVSSTESIARLHPDSSPYKSSAYAGLSSSTKFADPGLPFTTYPFRASRVADLPSSLISNLDLRVNDSLPFARTVTRPVNHFPSDITPRLPFDVTTLASLHKNNRTLHSSFHLPSHDDPKGLPPKTR
ncbi:hypothetical protein LIER_03340 [Lithospermum erythrorhizon]|uniref:Uncharacterized protein n=1 Tax=Lithospermum erythrorhizon TaxID=34254 RepID=A0AAV3NU34_LITER